jgi:hypothetical protein
MTWFMEHKERGNPWRYSFWNKEEKLHRTAVFSRMESNYIYSFLLQISSFSSLLLNFSNLRIHFPSLHMLLWRLHIHFLDIRYCIYHSLWPRDICHTGFFPLPFQQNFIVKITSEESDWQIPVGQPGITIHLSFMLLILSIWNAHAIIITGDFWAFSFRRTEFNIRWKMVNNRLKA